MSRIISFGTASVTFALGLYRWGAAAANQPNQLRSDWAERLRK
jgi:hypothetical protein